MRLLLCPDKNYSLPDGLVLCQSLLQGQIAHYPTLRKMSVSIASNSKVLSLNAFKDLQGANSSQQKMELVHCLGKVQSIIQNKLSLEIIIEFFRDDILI